jgi:hypothetical protein
MRANYRAINLKKEEIMKHKNKALIYTRALKFHQQASMNE